MNTIKVKGLIPTETTRARDTHPHGWTKASTKSLFHNHTGLESPCCFRHTNLCPGAGSDHSSLAACRSCRRGWRSHPSLSPGTHCPPSRAVRWRWGQRPVGTWPSTGVWLSWLEVRTHTYRRTDRRTWEINVCLWHSRSMNSCPVCLSRPQTCVFIHTGQAERMTARVYIMFMVWWQGQLVDCRAEDVQWGW